VIADDDRIHITLADPDRDDVSIRVREAADDKLSCSEAESEVNE